MKKGQRRAGSNGIVYKAVRGTVLGDSEIYTIRRCLDFQETELKGPLDNRREITDNAPNEISTRHGRGTQTGTEVEYATDMDGRDA